MNKQDAFESYVVNVPPLFTGIIAFGLVVVLAVVITALSSIYGAIRTKIQQRGK